MRPQTVIGRRTNPNKLERAREFRRRMTKTETLLWERLRMNRLQGFHFRRQQVIEGFIADFYCHPAALIVEVDGPVHEQRAEEDAARDEILRLNGLRILRFTNAQVMEHLDSVLLEIRRACHASVRQPAHE